jgi:hypothetical protein
MSWVVQFHDDFEPEFDELSRAVQDELLAQAKVVEKFGPTLGRPRVDTLSAYSDPNRHPFRVQIGTRSDRNRHLFRRKSAHPV